VAAVNKKQMAGVFGIPISVETLKAIGEYKEPISQKDVADYTMKMINAGEKDTNAQKFVDNLKDRFASVYDLIYIYIYIYIRGQINT
jgi:hypothetical protein